MAETLTRQIADGPQNYRAFPMNTNDAGHSMPEALRLKNSDGLLSSEDLKSEEECSLYSDATLVVHRSQASGADTAPKSGHHCGYEVRKMDTKMDRSQASDLNERKWGERDSNHPAISETGNLSLSETHDAQNTPKTVSRYVRETRDFHFDPRVRPE